MKKWPLSILLIFTVLVLSACKGEEEIVEVDEFDIFKEVLTGYTVEGTNGVTVDVSQLLDGDMIHQQVMTQRIDRSGQLTAKTVYFERQLALFNTEDDYEELNVTTYYQNDQMITDIEGEDLLYEFVSYKSYIEVDLVIQGLIKDHFASYDIQVSGQEQTITGELKIGSVRSIFGTDISMVNSNVLTITINEETKTLVEFSFVYTSDQTETTLMFTPFYGDVEITIPNQE